MAVLAVNRPIQSARDSPSTMVSIGPARPSLTATVASFTYQQTVRWAQATVSISYRSIARSSEPSSVHTRLASCGSSGTSSGEHFIRFLNESTIEVTLTRDKTTIGKGQLRLQDTRVIHFDPHREDSQPVLEEFPLHDGQTDKPIGVVTMVLHAERNAAPADPITDGQLDTDDIMPFTKRSEQLRQTYGTRQNSKAGLQPSSGKSRLTGAQIRKNHNIFIRKVKQQNRNLYSYRFGRRHSGMVVGHKACMKQEQLVPAHMGWRWNTCTAGIGKRRPGWRPGAVRKPIEQLMQHFLKCYPTDNVPVTGKRVVKFEPPSADRPLAGQKPTLHITKQHGEYSITMNPLKDSETLKTTKDAYLPCKPIKFRLSKDPRLTKLFMLRDELKAKGLTLCGCRELERCEHRSEREKRLLVDELRRTAKRFGLPLDTSVADLPSRSESELDVEFTPPSAIIRPGERRPDVVFAETQYCAEDFQIKPPAVEKRQGPKKATSSAMPRDMPASLAGKVPASRTLGGASGHGKGDGAARAPETSAKKIPAGANAPGHKSTTLPKGGDGAKRGTPAEPEVKGTGVRISVAKAKGPPKK
uniref:DUF4776 domain-containing protein n=1 Tax=Anopheles atroparvus TaxID=41427 RepID=A0A182ISM6_ANOAO